MNAGQKQPLSPIAAAVLAPTMTYRHNPYDRLNPKVIVEENVRGVMPYNECELMPAAPSSCKTTQITAGNLLKGMKPARVRWVVKKVTGVTPLSIRECRKNSKGRKPTGFYFLTVRAEDADRILEKSESALCLQNSLWAPQNGLYDVVSVAKELKHHEDSPVNALTFEEKAASIVA